MMTLLNLVPGIPAPGAEPPDPQGTREEKQTQSAHLSVWYIINARAFLDIALRDSQELHITERRLEPNLLGLIPAS